MTIIFMDISFYYIKIELSIYAFLCCYFSDILQRFLFLSFLFLTCYFDSTTFHGVTSMLLLYNVCRIILKFLLNY